MTLGDYLRTKNLTRKSLYIRHYSRSKRELEYKLLKKPAKEYSVWYDDDGVESGIEIDAELYHALDLPASESEEPVHTERTSYEFKHIAPPWAGG